MPRVTQQLIDLAIKNDGCPVCLALSTVLVKDTRIEIDGIHAIIDDKVFRLPDICIDFLKNFNNGKSTKPFGFRL